MDEYNDEDVIGHHHTHTDSEEDVDETDRRDLQPVVGPSHIPNAQLKSDFEDDDDGDEDEDLEDADAAAASATAEGPTSAADTRLRPAQSLPPLLMSLAILILANKQI